MELWRWSAYKWTGEAASVDIVESWVDIVELRVGHLQINTTACDSQDHPWNHPRDQDWRCSRKRKRLLAGANTKTQTLRERSTESSQKYEASCWPASQRSRYTVHCTVYIAVYTVYIIQLHWTTNGFEAFKSRRWEREEDAWSAENLFRYLIAPLMLEYIHDFTI